MTSNYFNMYRDRWIDSWLIVDVDTESPDGWYRRSLQRGVSSDYVVQLALKNSGPETDMTFTPLRTLLARSSLADVFRRVCGPEIVQSLQANIEGGPDDYRVIHALRECDCVDMKRSTCPVTGRPAPFIVLNRGRIAPVSMFWTTTWPTLVIREDLKKALEEVGARGVKFKQIEVA